MKSNEHIELSIIIVNWNSKEYLKKCISSILASTHGIEYEVVVIDNGSSDGSGDMLKQYYPRVHFIQSEKNIGFAKANNEAFKVSRGQTILFLNPDTEIQGAAINILYHQLNSLLNVGIVGAKLLNSDKSIQTSCIQAFPTIINQFLDSEFLRRLLPRSILWGNAPLFAAHMKSEEVGVISGACMMVKRSVFEQIGLFSEDYFMYAEDLDLCYKIKQAGYTNYFIPDATVIHFGGASTEKSPSDFSVVMMHESVWRFMRKTRGNIYGLAYRVSTLISAIGRLVLLIIILPWHLRGKDAESWNSSLKKWKAILTWSSGLNDLKY